MKLLEIKRYWNFFKKIFEMQAMQNAEYRADMIMVFLASWGYMVMSLVFLFVFFGNVTEIGGWNKYETITLFAVGQLVFYLNWSFFGSVSEAVGKFIQEGSLDRFLLYPLNALYNISVCSPDFIVTIPSFIFTGAVLVWGYIHLESETGLAGMILCVLLMIVGCLQVTFYNLCISLLSFWLTDVRSIHRVRIRLQDLYKFPRDIYPQGSIRAIFTYVIPIALTAYVPAYVLVKGFDLSLILVYLFVTVMLFGLTLLLWGMGKKV